MRAFYARTGAEGVVMKNLLLAGVAFVLAAPALAADLPTKKAPMPIPVVTEYDWTGIFFGGNVGWAWGHESFNSYNLNTGAFTNSGSDSRSSFIGGGQVGYRYMFPQRFVIGAAATLDWNNSSSVTNTTIVGNKYYRVLNRFERPQRLGRGDWRLCVGRLPSLYLRRLGVDQPDGHPDAALQHRGRGDPREFAERHGLSERLDDRRRTCLSYLVELGSFRPVYVYKLWKRGHRLFRRTTADAYLS